MKMKIPIPLYTLAIGLIFGCTPREQASTGRDTLSSVSTTTIEMADTPVQPLPAIKPDSSTTAGKDQNTKQSPKGTQQNPDKIMRKSITNVLEANTHVWMDIPGVNGTGEGRDPNGNPAIIIFTDRDASEIQSKLPSEKDGYPIIIREIGVVKPLGVED